MPPIFMERSFSFGEGEEVPEHTEGYPREAGDPTKYHLHGYDTFSHEDYPLAIDIGDLPTAQMLAAARRRHLEEIQPTSSSGGQAGIQDRTSIVYPRADAQDSEPTS